MASSFSSVSVVIPAYNRAHCITIAIDSVLAQSLPVEEILVVDDASTDGLAEVLAAYGDKVRLVKHTSNRGAAATRNTGIEVARGDYIAFLDSDDEWAPDKNKQQVAFMRENELHASCTNFAVVREDGQQPAVTTIARRPYAKRLSVEDMIWGCFVSPGSTLICRTQELRRVAGYDPELSRYEDWDLLLRLLAEPGFRMGFLNRPLARILAGIHFRSRTARQALVRLTAKHRDWISKRGLTDRLQFHSALAFARSSLFFAEPRYVMAVVWLVYSFLLHPFRHWPMQVVFWNRFFRRQNSQEIQWPARLV